MKIDILTLFPQILLGFFESSIASRAVNEGLLRYNLVDIRDFASDKHRTCDDYPYGGGPGMILKPEPLSAALESVNGKKKRVVYPTPSGKLFTQEYAERLSKEKELVFICGRYEGVDQRIIDYYVDDEISIGDYIISSGEIATLVLVDSIYRLLEGVISKESLIEESFNGGLLEYPQYTRPREYLNLKVPDILLSGHHENIIKWRRDRSLEKTKKNRPDILSSEKLLEEVSDNLKEINDEGDL